MEFVLILILLVVILGIITTIVLFTLKYLKGSVKITMPKNSFQEPENITGNIELKAKKTIESNQLIVSIIGQEIISRRDSRGRLRKNYNEIYKFEQILENTTTYPAGTQKSYSFGFQFPQIPNFNPQNNQIQNTINTISSISRAINGNFRNKRLEWTIKVRVDASGVDLTNSKRIYLNFLSNEQNIQNFQNQNTIIN